MLAQIATRGAVIGRRPTLSLKKPIGSLILLLALALLAQGCRETPSLQAGPDPSNPRAPVQRSTYRSTIGSYTSQRPVDPTPWRGRNDDVAPASKP